jgi:hypothetical protein
MSGSKPAQPEREAGMLLRQFAEQAFSRAAGAPLIAGNRVRILKNAEENYPASVVSGQSEAAARGAPQRCRGGTGNKDRR